MQTHKRTNEYNQYNVGTDNILIFNVLIFYTLNLISLMFYTTMTACPYSIYCLKIISNCMNGNNCQLIQYLTRIASVYFIDIMISHTYLQSINLN